MRHFINCPHCGTPVSLPDENAVQMQTDEGAMPTYSCSHCNASFGLDSLVEETSWDRTPVEESAAILEDAAEGRSLEVSEFSESELEIEIEPEVEAESESPRDIEIELTDQEEELRSIELASEGGPAIVFSVDDDTSSLPNRWPVESLEGDVELVDSTESNPEPSADFHEPEMPMELELELDESESDTLEFGEPVVAETESDMGIGREEEAIAEDSPLTPVLEPEGGRTFAFASQPATAAVESPFEMNTPNWSVLESASPRRRRPEASAFRKIVPPVLGGLASIPIATAIMWYGFGKDLGTTGQFVSQYVPWIVPAKFHKKSWDYAAEPSRNKNEVSSSSARNGVLPKLGGDRSSKFEPLTPSNTRSNKTESLADPKDENEETESSSDSVVQKPELPSSSGSLTPDLKAVAISELIEKTRAMQRGWASTPASQQIALIENYRSVAKQLSEESFKLKGRSAQIWRKELQTWGREVSGNRSYKLSLHRAFTGRFVDKGIPGAQPGDFAAVTMIIEEQSVPAPNAKWVPKYHWIEAWDSEVVVEMLPGAWPMTQVNLPTECLVFGKLVEAESTSALIFQIHMALPNN